MDPHQFGRAAFDFTLQGGAKLSDPGMGLQISLNGKSFGVCGLTLAAASETRSLPDPTVGTNGIGVGVRVIVVADEITNSGTCTVNGVLFTAEGDWAEFIVVQYNSTKAWVALRGTSVQLLASGTSAISGFVGTTAGRSVFLATSAGSPNTDSNAGGSLTITTGAGGAAANENGGNGGSLSLTAGVGGAGQDVGTSGNGGSIVLTVGAGGTGGGTNGIAGFIQAAGLEYHAQANPGTLNSTGTLTAALLTGGIVTSTTGAAVAATLDTGSAMDTALGTAMGTNTGFYWSVINTGGNTLTVTASSGHSIVGTATVVTVVSARFFTRRTAANTWITYRMGG